MFGCKKINHQKLITLVSAMSERHRVLTARGRIKFKLFNGEIIFGIFKGLGKKQENKEMEKV